ncbi:MAG: 50S ribosomal protein L4 [Candidatus Babeliaceae bacterium]|nr:50S ribosomal protein L4 [Candidatus Babeliaceae bacterium]
MTAREIGLKEREGASISPANFATAIRVLLQNWRQGTVGCKSRSEVNKTGKKPFKQKGTGRARAGTARSPLWRGGGVVFGPQPRVRKLKISRKASRQVMSELVRDRIENGRVVALPIEWQDDKPKTSVAVAALKKAGLLGSKLVVLVPAGDFRAHASFVNVDNVRVLFFDQVNAYDLAIGEYWVFGAHDKEHFKEMVGRWI